MPGSDRHPAQQDRVDNRQGVPQDDARAVLWWRKAAEQGDPMSQSNLGVMYQSGRGVPQDFAEAYFWLDLALAGNLESDRRKAVEPIRNSIAQRLSPATLTQVQARATQWFEQHH